MRFTGGTSDGTATAGHPSGRNGRIDLSRPQSFPRSLASRTHQAFVALLSAGSLFFLAACGGGPPAAPGQAATNPSLLPVPAWNLCDRRETVLMHEAGRRTERVPWGAGEEITVYRPTAGRDSEYHLFFDDRGLLIGYIGILYEGLGLAAQRDYTTWLAKQHVAKGETAHFGLWGQKENDAAIEAYLRAIEIGLSEPLYQAEAHHRLGLAYRDKGALSQAAAEMETSLKIRPSIPEVVNHLGKVYSLMGDKTRAAEAFHTAIGLRPNYADAHFNLAEAIEDTQPRRRALTAYDNFLAYVENSPEEKERIEKAEKRIEALKKAGK